MQQGAIGAACRRKMHGWVGSNDPIPTLPTELAKPVWTVHFLKIPSQVRARVRVRDSELMFFFANLERLKSPLNIKPHGKTAFRTGCW